MSVLDVLTTGLGSKAIATVGTVITVTLVVLCCIQTYRITLWESDYSKLETKYSEECRVSDALRAQLKTAEASNAALKTTIEVNDAQCKSALDANKAIIDARDAACEQRLTREQNRYEVLLKASNVKANTGEVADAKTDEAFRKSINAWINDWNNGNRSGSGNNN